jgi:hypothetical protein
LTEQESDNTATLRRWLEVLVQKSGSDLFLVEGLPPMIRVAGKISQISEDPLLGKDIEAAILQALLPRLAQGFRMGLHRWMLRFNSNRWADSVSICIVSADDPQQRYGPSPQILPAFRNWDCPPMLRLSANFPMDSC